MVQFLHWSQRYHALLCFGSILDGTPADISHQTLQRHSRRLKNFRERLTGGPSGRPGRSQGEREGQCSWTGWKREVDERGFLGYGQEGMIVYENLIVRNSTGDLSLGSTKAAVPRVGLSCSYALRSLQASLFSVAF